MPAPFAGGVWTVSPGWSRTLTVTALDDADAVGTVQELPEGVAVPGGARAGANCTSARRSRAGGSPSAMGST